MSWRFRKRVKVLPGVTLNLSKSGISTTIGKKGASVNVGSKGTFLNLGLPGTGLYSRKKIADAAPNSTPDNSSNNKGCLKCLGYIAAAILVLGIIGGIITLFDKSEQTPLSFADKQKESFMIEYYNYGKEVLNRSNSISRQEYIDSVHLALGQHMDSIMLLVDWRAEISYISLDRSEKSNNDKLSFNLTMYPDSVNLFNYHKTVFDVNYVFPTSKESTDKIYQTVKNLKEYSTVYFDGFIRQYTGGLKPKGEYSIDTNNPSFDFFITDIKVGDQHNPTLSESLFEAISLVHDNYSSIKKYYKNGIYLSKTDKEISQVVPKFEKIKLRLKEDELAYVMRYYHALAINARFMDETFAITDGYVY